MKKKSNRLAIDVLNELHPEPITSGQAMKAKRTNFGITLSEISKVTGISPNNLSDLENGKKKFGLISAIKIGMAIGLEPMTLLYPDGYENSAEYKTVLKKSKKLLNSKISQKGEQVA